jgi:3D (Asp-Asp-Asp) domain-containing protein
MHSKSKHLKKITKKISRAIEDKLNVIVLIFMVFCSMNFPQHSMAQSASAISQELVISSNSSFDIEEYSLSNAGSLPKIEEKEPTKRIYVYASAYNSLPSQTDASPCTTATGFNVCEHGIEDTIAMNNIPLGTKIKIPALYGDRIFEVRDRMNARYGSDRADIWMKNLSDAKKFGRKYVQIEIYQDSKLAQSSR